jgi:hypothetical protein
MGRGAALRGFHSRIHAAASLTLHYLAPRSGRAALPSRSVGTRRRGTHFLGNCYCKKLLRTWYRECSSGHTSGGRQLRCQKLTRSPRPGKASHRKNSHRHLTVADWLAASCRVGSGCAAKGALPEFLRRARPSCTALNGAGLAQIANVAGRHLSGSNGGRHHQSRTSGGRPSPIRDKRWPSVTNWEQKSWPYQSRTNGGRRHQSRTNGGRPSAIGGKRWRPVS